MRNGRHTTSVAPVSHPAFAHSLKEQGGLFQECCDFFDEYFGLDRFVEEVFHRQP